ncbi:Glycosyl transferase, group 1 [uncultured Alphaproteobacteria bacterium]|uniref:Glycosyl transferase, group 1 n=1 Tax=uncultured Alphaproteobacteria bacterium TaxID=91750 RepID=A0A212KD90_9PROT|nr:Glycosyl transferase, group 1 [uncultured Alphaproteobacteria bacterium]
MVGLVSARAPRVHILFPFREGPWGGGNQMLAALRDMLRERGQWTDAPEDADAVLFDSFNGAAEVIACKRRLPEVPFVHRINGPVHLYRGEDSGIDGVVIGLADKVADGVIFQSEYTRQGFLGMGLREPRRSTVILNAPDRRIFHAEGRAPSADGRLRLIAVSWSANWNKGFDVYRHLDETLDFSRYDMTFVGNSPIAFRNIRQLPPRDSADVAALLRRADIFITASRDDPCSNSLAEAIACGAVPVAQRSGGHPELVGEGGTLFDGKNDVLAAVEAAADALGDLRAKLPDRSADGVADAYAAFVAAVCADTAPRKRLSPAAALELRAQLLASRARSKWFAVKRGLKG